MFRNYLKVALRNLIRERGYAIINIAGLTIGIASCILILLFITNELTYDRHHEKADRIYRIGVEAMFGDSHFFSSYTSGAMKDALDYEFSEVEQSMRLSYLSRPVVKLGDKTFVEEKFFYADSNFFDVFSVPLISGDPATALSSPNSMVISSETARRYFGNENPIGKNLQVNERKNMVISGVMENFPNNSHFKCDFIGSLETIRNNRAGYWEYWTNNELYTYILLDERSEISEFENKIQELVYKYVGPEVEKVMGIDIETFEAGGGRYQFFLEHLPDIYLHSKADHQITPGGNISYIYFFSIIAFFILIIACINFMNMATARYANRAREVGVRKVVGSTRGQLMQQFLTESVLISLIAIIFAMTIVELVLPYFNQLTQKDLHMSYINNWAVLPMLVLFGVLVGIIAGSYPAFFLSSFKPVSVLKAQVRSGVTSNALRKILVVVQFTITIALLTGTFLVSEQLDYWQSRDQGYDKEGILIIKRTNILGEQQQAFRNEILQNKGIINASYCSSVPGYSFGGTSLHRHGASAEELVQTGHMHADEYYLETLGMEMAKGRFFSDEFGTDTDAVVVNESFVRIMGLDDPVNQSVVFGHLNLTSPVIGVLKNANFESMHRSIRPMTISKLDGIGWLMAVRMENEDVPALISYLEETWRSFAPDSPFIYSFLENDLIELYSQEMRTGRIFTVFSVLAIFIACLGLLGMASFTAEKRTKEIGIRKAMGAPVASIYTLLTKEIVYLVVFATLIAWPLTWYVMNIWLDNFAYRIDPGLMTFVLSTLIAFIIAVLTVSYQARKAAIANPVNSLKYE
jgi:putative ABC transport system permease protein